MVPSHPISREELVALLGEVDESVIERIRAVGATLDEIGEAIDEMHGRVVDTFAAEASVRIGEVRQIFEDLFENHDALTPSSSCILLPGVSVKANG
jgi:hypothetical protein